MLEQMTPQHFRLAPFGLAHRPPHRSPRLSGDDHRLPGHRGHVILVGLDLHLIAVLQLRAQRHRIAVDLAADAGIADVGVNRIGKIDRRRAARQGDQAPFRRETENLIVKQFKLGVFQEVDGGIAFGQRLDGAP